MEKNNNEIEIKIPEIKIDVPEIDIQVPKVKEGKINISRIAWYLVPIPLIIQFVLYLTEA